MNQKGFVNIIVIIGIVILAGVAGYFIVNKRTLPPKPAPSPTSTLTPTPTPSPSPQHTPQSTNFNFVFGYGVGAKNELDTFEKTYTRDMVIDPPVKIKMSLTDEEMNKIYQKMLEINFFDFPDEFSVTVPIGEATGMVTPCSSYYFKVSNESRIKELSWDDCITIKNERADKLRELIRYMESIIESKKEYKKLPTPRGGYL